jgi:hypothetical protein
MHPCPFQARFDDQFIRTFDDATANRPPLRLKHGVLHVPNPLFQVRQVLRKR